MLKLGPNMAGQIPHLSGRHFHGTPGLTHGLSGSKRSVDCLQLGAVALTGWTFLHSASSEGDGDMILPSLRVGLFLQDPLKRMAGALLFPQDLPFPTAHISFQEGIYVAAAGLEGHA